MEAWPRGPSPNLAAGNMVARVTMSRYTAPLFAETLIFDPRPRSSATFRSSSHPYSVLIPFLPKSIQHEVRTVVVTFIEFTLTKVTILLRRVL